MCFRVFLSLFCCVLSIVCYCKMMSVNNSENYISICLDLSQIVLCLHWFAHIFLLLYFCLDLIVSLLIPFVKSENGNKSLEMSCLAIDQNLNLNIKNQKKKKSVTKTNSYLTIDIHLLCVLCVRSTHIYVFFSLALSLRCVKYIQSKFSSFWCWAFVFSFFLYFKVFLFFFCSFACIFSVQNHTHINTVKNGKRLL